MTFRRIRAMLGSSLLAMVAALDFSMVFCQIRKLQVCFRLEPTSVFVDGRNWKPSGQRLPACDALGVFDFMNAG